MGPLLPISILLGSFWYLDREREREQRTDKKQPPPQPQFSPLAVGRVASLDAAGVRAFQPGIAEELAPTLKSHSIEPLEYEGTPPGVHIFRLVPYQVGTATAAHAVDAAVQSGQVVLGSLGLVLGGGPDQQLLLIGGPEAKRFANPRSAFALLVDLPAPVVAPEPEPAPEPPVKRERKAKSNGMTNGASTHVEAAPAEVVEVTES